MDLSELMDRSSDQLTMFGEMRANIDDYIKEAMLCKALRKQQEEELKANSLERVFYECELPLVEVLAAMESTGILCDRAYLDEFGKSLDTEIAALEKDI